MSASPFRYTTLSRFSTGSFSFWKGRHRGKVAANITWSCRLVGDVLEARFEPVRDVPLTFVVSSTLSSSNRQHSSA
jgi:hypothetical protein